MHSGNIHYTVYFFTRRYYGHRNICMSSKPKSRQSQFRVSRLNQPHLLSWPAWRACLSSLARTSSQAGGAGRPRAAISTLHNYTIENDSEAQIPRNYVEKWSMKNTHKTEGNSRVLHQLPCLQEHHLVHVNQLVPCDLEHHHDQEFPTHQVDVCERK